MNFENVLLTGAAGLLGSILREELASKVKRLRSTDIAALSNAAPNEELAQADLGDVTVMPALVAGMDAVVHFGGLSKESDFESIARVNIMGTRALYEAARNAGVRRVVLASSVHAVGFYEQTDVIDAEAPTRPDSNYGLSKVFMEALAQLYWDKYGLETVSIRIGSCEAVPSNRRHLLSWLSFRDMTQLVDLALSAARVKHTIIYGCSNNSGSFWDNKVAKHLGYSPVDSADAYRDEILKNATQSELGDPVIKFQGGLFTV